MLSSRVDVPQPCEQMWRQSASEFEQPLIVANPDRPVANVRDFLVSYNQKRISQSTVCYDTADLVERALQISSNPTDLTVDFVLG